MKRRGGNGTNVIKARHADLSSNVSIVVLVQHAGRDVLRRVDGAGLGRWRGSEALAGFGRGAGGEVGWAELRRGGVSGGVHDGEGEREGRGRFKGLPLKERCPGSCSGPE